MRISTLPSLIFIPIIFFYMLPSACIFALPLASALSVQFVYGSISNSNAHLLLSFFGKTKKIFYSTILIFSFFLTIFYSTIIFEFAPKSYLLAKKSILEFAKTHISSLDSGKFHKIGPNVTIFFKNKEKISNKPAFYNILIALKLSDHEVIINAKSGVIIKNILQLADGSVYTKDKEKGLIARFERSEFDIEKLLFEQSGLDSTNSSILGAKKFLTWSKIKKLKDQDAAANIEFHSRILKTIWQLLFPIIAIFGTLVFSSKKFSLLGSIVWSGSLILFSHLIIGVSATLSNTNIALLLMYGLTTLFFLVTFIFSRKKL